MEQHGHEAHVGQLAVVLHQRAAAGASVFVSVIVIVTAACLQHQVAAVEAELGLCVLAPQFGHEVRGMQIAAGLASYKIVFHRGAKVRISERKTK